MHRSSNSLFLRDGLTLEFGDLTSEPYFSCLYLDSEFKDCFSVSQKDVLTLVNGCCWVGLPLAPSVQCFNYINTYIVLSTGLRA